MLTCPRIRCESPSHCHDQLSRRSPIKPVFLAHRALSCDVASPHARQLRRPISPLTSTLGACSGLSESGAKSIRPLGRRRRKHGTRRAQRRRFVSLWCARRAALISIEPDSVELTHAK